MFAIYFGKDIEDLDSGCWFDSLNIEDEKEIKRQSVGKFETDNVDFFWEMFLNLNENPPAMWYWVFVDNRLYMSGAIDPNDIEMLSYQIATPDWVKEYILNRYKGGQQNDN